MLSGFIKAYIALDIDSLCTKYTLTVASIPTCKNKKVICNNWNLGLCAKPCLGRLCISTLFAANSMESIKWKISNCALLLSKLKSTQEWAQIAEWVELALEGPRSLQSLVGSKRKIDNNKHLVALVMYFWFLAIFTKNIHT